MNHLAASTEMRTRSRARLAIVALCLFIAGFFPRSLSAQQPASNVASSHGIPPVVASFDPAPDGANSGTSPLGVPAFGWGDVADSTSMPAPIVPLSQTPANASNEGQAGPPAPSSSATDPRRYPLEASWTDGFRLDSPNQDFHLHFGGAAMIDSVWFIGPASAFNAPGGAASTVGNSSATLLRRAILQADGDLFDQFDFSIQFDFANASNDNDGEQPPTFSNLTTSPAPLNVWIQVRDVPFFGYVRFGNQDKPIGFENNTASTDLAFMERSDNQDAFYGPFDNGFALGLAAQNWTESQRITWRYGIFRPSTNVFGVALNKYSIGARVTALPLYENDGEELIHLGLGYWGGELVQDELRDRARPLLRNAPGFADPILVDTSELGGSRQYTIGPEFALVWKSLTVQAEYAGQFFTDATDTNGVNQGTVFYHGGYVQVLYFLTGEVQPYNKQNGVFGSVVPLHDYHLKKGDCYWSYGAWQVGVRFGWLDPNDKDIVGGALYDWTAGVNWFLNANMKLQFNFIAEHRDVPDVTPGWITGIGVRAAYNF